MARKRYLTKDATNNIPPYLPKGTSEVEEFWVDNLNLYLW